MKQSIKIIMKSILLIFIILTIYNIKLFGKNDSIYYRSIYLFCPSCGECTSSYLGMTFGELNGISYHSLLGHNRKQNNFYNISFGNSSIGKFAVDLGYERNLHLDLLGVYLSLGLNLTSGFGKGNSLFIENSKVKEYSSQFSFGVKPKLIFDYDFSIDSNFYKIKLQIFPVYEFSPKPNFFPAFQFGFYFPIDYVEIYDED